MWPRFRSKLGYRRYPGTNSNKISPVIVQFSKLSRGHITHAYCVFEYRVRTTNTPSSIQLIVGLLQARHPVTASGRRLAERLCRFVVVPARRGGRRDAQCTASGGRECGHRGRKPGPRGCVLRCASHAAGAPAGDTVRRRSDDHDSDAPVRPGLHAPPLAGRAWIRSADRAARAGLRRRSAGAVQLRKLEARARAARR